jgi:hypothetical protein
MTPTFLAADLMRGPAAVLIAPLVNNPAQAAELHGAAKNSQPERWNASGSVAAKGAGPVKTPR